MYSPGKRLQDPDDEEDQLEDGGGLLIPAAFSNKNINHKTIMQEDFSLSSPALKSAKKRKAKAAETHGGGGGRIVRAAGRKDRHSKVSTARGPRDRRLRLSPRTAIQFYDVQDRLGYDRPSKAIDWLIKEAKAAIDALEPQPPGKNGTFTNEKNQQMQQGGGGFFISDETHDSGFAFLADAAAVPPCTMEMQGYTDGDPNLYQGFHQGFFSDWEIARLQKLLTADNSSSGNSPPLHFPATAVVAVSGGGDGEILAQREPLQSSVINYSPINSAHFSGLSFSSELSKITAVGAIKEGEKEKKTVSSRPSFTAPFLH